MSADSISHRGHKWLLRLIRVAMSAGLLAYLLSRVELTEVLATLATTNPSWLGLAVVMLAAGKVILGLRWRVLVKARGLTIPLSSLISSILIGSFFSSTLPTEIGGDAFRAYDVSRKANARLADGLGSVVIDRILGALGLALFATLTLLLGRRAFPAPGGQLALVLAVLVTAIIVLATLAHPAFTGPIQRILHRVGWGGLSEVVSAFGDAVGSMMRSKGALSAGLALTLLLQVVVVIQYAFIAASLGLVIPFSYLLMAVPLALLVLLLPASISGIGLRETVFVYLLGRVSVTPHEAIALSWLAFGMLLLQAGVGAMLFAFRGRPELSRPEAVATDSGGRFPDIRRP